QVLSRRLYGAGKTLSRHRFSVAQTLANALEQQPPQDAAGATGFVTKRMARGTQNGLHAPFGPIGSLSRRLRSSGHADSMITIASYRVDLAEILLVLFDRRVNRINCLSCNRRRSDRRLAGLPRRLLGDLPDTGAPGGEALTDNGVATPESCGVCRRKPV